MRVKVELFGNWRDLVGSPSVEIEMPEGSTLRTVVELLAARYGNELEDWLVDPETGRMWSPFSMGLNNTFVDGVDDLTRELNEGDRVSLFHPVVGGSELHSGGET